MDDCMYVHITYEYSSSTLLINRFSLVFFSPCIFFLTGTSYEYILKSFAQIASRTYVCGYYHYGW